MPWGDRKDHPAPIVAWPTLLILKDFGSFFPLFYSGFLFFFFPPEVGNFAASKRKP